MDEVKGRMENLNDRFEDRWAGIGERLLKHKSNIDKLFAGYYEALDSYKEELLKNENNILNDLQSMDDELDKCSR